VLGVWIGGEGLDKKRQAEKVRKIVLARAAAIMWTGAMDRPRFMRVHEWLQGSLVVSALVPQTVCTRLFERARKACETGQRRLAAIALGFKGGMNMSTQWAAKELGWRWTMRGGGKLPKGGTE
jgi:hypothetical protein